MEKEVSHFHDLEKSSSTEEFINVLTNKPSCLLVNEQE